LTSNRSRCIHPSIPFKEKVKWERPKGTELDFIRGMLSYEPEGKTLKMEGEFECSFFEREPDSDLPDHLFDLTLNPNEMFTHFFGS
jgi:hypothetical protein